MLYGNSHHNYRYESYGQIEMPPGNFTNPHNHYTFTGQELDEHMALYEFYARAYDYDTGTWMQQDVYRGQVKMPRSLHRYGYVENSPTNLVDPYGYCPWCVVAVVVIVGGSLLANPEPVYAPARDDQPGNIDELVQRHEKEVEEKRNGFINQWVVPHVEVSECVNGKLGSCPWAVVGTALTVSGLKGVSTILKGTGKAILNGSRRYLTKQIVKETSEQVVRETGEQVIKELTEDGLQFASKELLESHFQKHATEFGYQTIDEYLKGAQKLISSKGTQTFVRSNGDTLFYNSITNEFAVLASDGKIIRTFFKPTKGINYWLEQIGKL